MARFQFIVGIPITLLFIGTISYLRSFLQIKSQNEQQISIDTFSGGKNIFLNFCHIDFKLKLYLLN